MVRFVKLIVWIAVAMAVIVVIAIVLFGQSAVYRVGMGAVESATNAVTNVTGGSFSHAQAAISGAVANMTRGIFSHAQAAISGALANVTRGK
jgi:hypothetical protein